MRYIDAFCHFSPKRFFDALLESPAGQKDIGKRVRGIPALYDLDLRLKVVDQFPDYTQVLSLGLPMVDRLWGPEQTPEMAKLANDGLADVCAKHPDRFVGYSAVVPMNNPDAAAKEAERALKNGANAVQLGTNVNGKPIDGKEFWPLYEVIEKSGKPILLHPARSREMIDYQGEAKSKYEICSVLGWPFETGVCLSRFIFSKIMDTYPKLKIVSHHLGGVIPYLEGPHRPQLRPDGRAHLRRRLRGAAQEPEETAVRLFQGFLRRHRDRGRAWADDLRHRFLWRRSCAVRLGLSVRQGEGAGLHPFHHRGAGTARSFAELTARRSVTGMRRRCSA